MDKVGVTVNRLREKLAEMPSIDHGPIDKGNYRRSLIDLSVAVGDACRALSVSRPAVKGLEWKELGASRFWPKIWYGSGVFRANYKVEQSHPDGPWHSIGGNFPTLESAKAAAQSDFEQRIWSALE